MLIILVVVLVMFGAKKLPELGDSLGKGIRAFKKATEHGFDEHEDSTTPPRAQQEHLPQGSTATTAAPSDAKEKTTGGDHRA